MQDLEEIANRGRKIYERLGSKLEAEFLNQCVCINVETGEYVLGGTFFEVHKKFEERFGDAPSWDTRVGEASHVSGRARILQ